MYLGKSVLARGMVRRFVGDAHLVGEREKKCFTRTHIIASPVPSPTYPIILPYTKVMMVD